VRASAHDRTLLWDGCLNVRDLGGHPTQDGGQTRFGAIVRGDSPRQLSDAGWETVVSYGIQTIVDLRFRDEVDADPPRELPVDVVHVSLLGEGVATNADAWAAVAAAAEAAPSGAAATQAVYLEFLERFRPRFGEAIAAIADAPDGALLIHCQGGKDRAGLIAALLLRLVGVDIDEIADDYALSADNLRPQFQAWLDDAPDAEERARRERISATPREAMAGVLEELEKRYGSVREYLLAAGATEAQLDRAAARLRA